ncbi:MAG: porphobilinogen synthase [Alphaproteobacteria bacterium]|nr:porphobilinogen synthase [Alphaproteobacteria bacterium]MDA7988722.1 porphobilinogen synthase [Alphaproteobacteria bacterium]MDA8010303.1 porphobilinogen synthase [Alphaproteobacteria bacterium]
MRRLRSAPWIRRLVSETTLSPHNLVLPIFLRENESVPAEIKSLPGVKRLTPKEALAQTEKAAALEISAVALFPWVDDADKDPGCRLAVNPENLVCRTIAALKKNTPEIGVICDVALDPYNSLGHDGLVSDEGVILNDETNALLAEQAVVLALAGADVVAPSDMMDGRVGVIRSALEGAGFIDTKILSYAAKFASCLYGPFRDAVGSSGSLRGDKRTYQMNPANYGEAMREVALDVGEGADMLMVKPGLPYLDIIRGVKDGFGLPTFAYQVSGEYAMLRYAADAGALEWERALYETALCLRRAGADGIFTYAAIDLAKLT